MELLVVIGIMAFVIFDVALLFWVFQRQNRRKGRGRAPLDPNNRRDG